MRTLRIHERNVGVSHRDRVWGSAVFPGGVRADSSHMVERDKGSTVVNDIKLRFRMMLVRIRLSLLSPAERKALLRRKAVAVLMTATNPILHDLALDAIWEMDGN